MVGQGEMPALEAGKQRALADVRGTWGDVMKPIASVEEGVRLIESFKGLPQEFQLAVPDTMLDDVGINMAVITDHVLKRGWEPDGFTQASGYRVFRYKALKKCN